MSNNNKLGQQTKYAQQAQSMQGVQGQGNQTHVT